MSLSHYAISIRGSNFLFVFQPSLFSFKEGIPSLLDDTLTSLLQLPAKRRTHKISLQVKDVYHIWFSISFSEHPHMLAPSWKYNHKMKDWATDQISAINNSWFVAWLNGSPPTSAMCSWHDWDQRGWRKNTDAGTRSQGCIVTARLLVPSTSLTNKHLLSDLKAVSSSWNVIKKKIKDLPQGRNVLSERYWKISTAVLVIS